MFTGIIQKIGMVKRVSRGEGLVVEIGFEPFPKPLEEGESVAVNGVCLTVAKCDQARFTADVLEETVSRTGIGDLIPGEKVNLERALRAGDSMGGHIVQGHVDCRGTVKAKIPKGRDFQLQIQCGRVLAAQSVLKGSIAVDGVSLTISAIGNDWIGVDLIPTTAAETILGAKKVGDKVNLEGDIVGKYIAKNMAKSGGLTEESLQRAGFFSVVVLAACTAFAAEPFAAGWMFSRDGGPAETVTLPHDGAIGADFDIKKFDTGCGALPYWGHGEYTKVVEVTAAEIAAGMDGWRFEFDGVMSHPKVFVNGQKAYEGKNGYASFVVPLKGLLREGTNEIRVAVDPPNLSSRWYPGFGIFREVRFVKAPADHVVPGSVALDFPAVTPTAAVVRATWEMSLGGKREKTLTIAAPQLWSPESPRLYELEIGDRKLRYGIRTLRFSPTDGFFLNGVHRQIRGVCLHHDLGVLGAAFDRDAARRQLSLLKEMGCDAIRTSHNFPAPALLDLCDEMGLMVLDEAFDEWSIPKVKNGVASYWDEHERLVRDFVRRDRNHPCVVMWSAGNELAEDVPQPGRAELGVAIARELTALFHAEDPQDRPVTAGHWRANTITNGVGFATDVFGANYLPHRYAEMRGVKGVIGTETCSAIATRGFYLPRDLKDKYAVTNRVNSYGYCVMHSNDYIPDVEFAAQDANPHVYGEFVWTGFDYIGEPDPWRGTSRSSYFGIFDLCGFPKDSYWQYRSHWRPDVPTAHILPHWNWKAGDRIPVVVYTSGDEAELFVNGVSQGRRTRGPREYRLVWNDIEWRPGVVSVRTWSKGRPWAEDKVETSGAFARFVFTDDAWGDLIFRTATAVDAQGRFVPEAAEPVPYETETPSGYDVVGTCNGDAAEMRSLQSREIRSFCGKALIVFRRKR